MDTEIFDNFDEFERIWNQLEDLKQHRCNNMNKTSQTCVNKYCEGVDFIQDMDEFTCKLCSTVQIKFIDTNAEWRYYGSDDSKSTNPTRCGLPMNDLLPRSSIGSVMGTENTANSKFFQYTRMRKYHLWNSMPYKERTLFNILSNLNIHADHGGLSKTIIEDAKILYKNLSEERISRGENRSGLVASSIYMACKSNKVPRSAKEIARMFNLSTGTMTKGCKKFNEIMTETYNSSTPVDFINRFCTKLNRPDIIKDCIRAVENTEKYAFVAENAPPSIAAGVIYLVCNHNQIDITKKDIAKVSEISEVTVNKCFKKLKPFINFILCS
jgi:transcription initiation factor TFIIB